MMTPTRLPPSLVAALLLLPTLAAAEDFYVRSGHAAGANTGADWNNAWRGFGSIVWGTGSGKLGAGDTLWIAGGVYAESLGIGASGEPGRPIALRRVRANDPIPVAAAGWRADFDATVRIDGTLGGISFDGGLGSHVLIDGRVPSGIHINYPDGGNAVSFDSSTDLTGITLRCIEAAGPGRIVQTADTRGFDLTITGLLRQLTISQCEIHNSDTLLQISASEGLVIERSSFHHSWAVNADRFHPNAIYLATVRNAVIRHNLFHDNSVEGLFFGDPGNVDVRIHGNVFYQGASPRDTGRGIEFDRRADSRDCLVYHNTFVGLPLPGVSFNNGQPHPGARIENNLFVDCELAPGPAAHDYNFTSLGSLGEANGIARGTALFVNAAAYDYHIAGAIAPDKPRNKGRALGPPYDVDRDGVTRGADGAWDIGAYEFVNTPPAISGVANVTALSGVAAGPLPFTIGDADTPAPNLALSASSSDPALLPGSAVTFGGAGTERTVTLSPAASATGSATVTLTVTDSDGASRSTSFLVSIFPGNLSGQTVTVGHDVSFSAPAGLGATQWQVSTDGGNTYADLVNGTDVSGATTSTLTLLGVAAAANNRRYRFTVRNGASVAASSAAVLTVSPAFFPYPTGIAVDGEGNLYIADASSHTIKKVDSANRVTLVAGTEGLPGAADGTGAAARFHQPGGLASSANATLSVADTANATIRRVSPAGVVTTLAGSPTERGHADGPASAATFASPAGLAVDAAGLLYVTDAMNHTLRWLTADRIVGTFAGSPGVVGGADGTGSEARFNFPTGVAIDRAGNCYVADTTNNTLRKITPLGVVTTLAGLAGVSGYSDGTGAAALFNRPTGLAADQEANLYLADTGNSTIRKVTPAGVVTTLAGLPGIAGLTDGAGNAAFFNQPLALALDAAGNLYVADTGNAAIRRVTPAGVVTTLALTAGALPEPPPATPPPAQTPTVTPSPGGGGGGGGGAPSLWFVAVLSVLAGARAVARLAQK